jgi:hypothetical protein
VDLEPARAGHDRVAAEAATALIAQGKADFDRSMLDLLGTAGARQLTEFQTTLTARALVARLAGVAVLSNMPVTPEQADKLIRALVQASNGAGKFGWSTVENQLGDILSQGQMALIGAEGLRPSDELRTALQHFRQATGNSRN